jgi:hypothetical protein
VIATIPTFVCFAVIDIGVSRRSTTTESVRRCLFWWSRFVDHRRAVLLAEWIFKGDPGEARRDFFGERRKRVVLRWPVGWVSRYSGRINFPPFVIVVVNLRRKHETAPSDAMIDPNWMIDRSTGFAVSSKINNNHCEQ